jgi:hypothetical protein
MERPHFSAGGDLVYLSERKLNNLSVLMNLPTEILGPAKDLTVEGSAGINIGPLGHASLGLTQESTRIDLTRRERALHDRLVEVIRRLEPGELPRLDSGRTEIAEAGWFSFHRKLRFGVGTDDGTHAVRALIAVDDEPVDPGSPYPGLLMNGSPAHVLPPYAVDSEQSTAHRSGSGSGMLFQWLDRVREQLESHPRREIADLEIGEIRPSPSRERDASAIMMYGMFARLDGDHGFSFSQLLNSAPCEGVAQASLIAVDPETTVVLASPLYIRVRALDLPGADDPPLINPARGKRLRRFLRIPEG